jgi:hypothetical protein
MKAILYFVKFAYQVKQIKMDCTLMWGGLDAVDFLLSVQFWRESGIGAEIQKQATVIVD